MRPQPPHWPLVALLIQTRGGPLARDRRAGTLVVTLPPDGAPQAQAAVSDAVRKHATHAKLDMTHWQELLDLQSLLAEYLRKIGEPGAG